MRSTRRQASGAFRRIGTSSSVSYGSRLSASFEKGRTDERVSGQPAPPGRDVFDACGGRADCALGSEIKELSGDQWRAEEQALLNRFRKASAAA